jgi:hypothetical protein
MPMSKKEFNPVMSDQEGNMKLPANNRRLIQGVTAIEPEIPARFWRQCRNRKYIKSLPGVNLHNELSTQYAVREITMKI